MPVLLKNSQSQGACGPALDVETLVTEVKDRLCLRSRDKFFPGKRAVPYQRSSPCEMCRPNCQYSKKHFSSPSSISQKRIRQKHLEHCFSCSACQKTGTQPSKNIEDARTMLEKLLAEQSLIQEAVRRLQAQRVKCLSLCSNEKVFPFSADDSSSERSTTGGFTPSFSESEDDSLSQHSVNL